VRAVSAGELLADDAGVNSSSSPKTGAARTSADEKTAGSSLNAGSSASRRLRGVRAASGSAAALGGGATSASPSSAVVGVLGSGGRCA